MLADTTARPTRRALLRGLAALAALPVLVTTATPASAVAFPDSGLQSVTQVSTRTLTDGVVLTGHQVATASGTSRANLLTVDVRVARTDLLTAPKVASNQRLDTMATAAGAIGAVNADFFQNTQDAAHTGVSPTGAAVGVQIRDGAIIKSFVPRAQRHGEGMPAAVNVGGEVVGVGRDGRAVVTRVDLTAFVNSRATGVVPLSGLNLYGMGRHQVVAFDEQWGAASRQRAACGSDARRTDPCTTDVLEVVLTDGVVSSVSATPGRGQLAANQIALLGREDGADALRPLRVGDKVSYQHRPIAANGGLDWAVGGGVMVKGGQLANIANQPLNPRTYAGASGNGRYLYLLVVDGRDNVSAGVSTRDGADLIRHLGASDAVLLDGGGSSTMVVRPTVTDPFEVVSRSNTSGALRAIPNGIGIMPRTSADG